MSDRLYDSQQDADGKIKIYRLTKMRNGSFRGARYFYEVRDGEGRRISSTSDNKDFVAGIVGRHAITARPGEHVYSLSGMTQTPANLGKTMTSGGRSGVFGIALIETVEIGGEFRPVIRTGAGDDFGPKGSAIDWATLPKEFRAILPVDASEFRTLKPPAGEHAAGWIYDGKRSFTDPGHPGVSLPDMSRPRQDIATPETATSDDETLCWAPGPGELFCQRDKGHSDSCAARSVDATLGVEIWTAESEPTEALKNAAIMSDADVQK